MRSGYDYEDVEEDTATEAAAPAAPSDEQIRAFVEANIGNPALIAETAAQYGVSIEDLSRATGYGQDAVVSYFQQADVSPPAYEPPPTGGLNAVAETTAPPPPEIYEPPQEPEEPIYEPPRPPREIEETPRPPPRPPIEEPPPRPPIEEPPRPPERPPIVERPEPPPPPVDVRPPPPPPIEEVKEPPRPPIREMEERPRSCTSARPFQAGLSPVRSSSRLQRVGGLSAIVSEQSSFIVHNPVPVGAGLISSTGTGAAESGPSSTSSGAFSTWRAVGEQPSSSGRSIMRRF